MNTFEPDLPPLNDEDEDLHISDLDRPGSRRRAGLPPLIQRAQQSLLRHKRWSTGLSLLLIIMLAGIFLWQLPRSNPPPITHPPHALSTFLSATTLDNLIFIQNNNLTLSAYQLTTGEQLWRMTLPAVSSLQASHGTLFVYFRLSSNQAEMRALNAYTGRQIWKRPLPSTLMNVNHYSGVVTMNASNAPDFSLSSDGSLIYILTAEDTLLALQTANGQTAWLYQAPTSQPHAVTPGSSNQLLAPFWLTSDDGVLQFNNPDGIYWLDESTGRLIFMLKAFQANVTPVLDGKILYLLPAYNQPSPTIQAIEISTGQILWRLPLPRDTWAYTEAQGVIYLESLSNPRFMALSTIDTRQLWSYQSSDHQPFMQAQALNGSFFLLQADGTLLNFQAASGRLLWRTYLANMKNLGQTSQEINPIGLLQDNQNLILFNEVAPALQGTQIDVLNPTSGEILWASQQQIQNPLPCAGLLLELTTNGNLNGWNERTGHKTWSFNAPVGVRILRTITAPIPILLLLSPLSILSVVRVSDGRLLWHYPQ